MWGGCSQALKTSPLVSRMCIQHVGTKSRVLQTGTQIPLQVHSWPSLCWSLMLRGMFWGIRDCSKVSGATLGGQSAWDMLPGSRLERVGPCILELRHSPLQVYVGPRLQWSQLPWRLVAGVVRLISGASLYEGEAQDAPPGSRAYP